MDPTQKFNLTLKSSQVVTEETYPDDAGASQHFSETLIKHLSKLTLNTSTEFPSSVPEGSLRQQSAEEAFLREIEDELPYSRKRVRTLLSVNRERLARLRYTLLDRSPRDALRRKRFICPCSFCESSGWDPSENARIGNYDTKPLQP
nr:developmental pluripotency-associated protein 3-like [Saimiri boliviensis boliviensis]